jgi:hypothetical protein
LRKQGARARARGAKGIKKKSDVPTYVPAFFEIFLRFLGLILENIFMVFLGSSCRETANSAIKQIDGKRREGGKKILNFFGQKLLTWTSPKKCLWCF